MISTCSHRMLEREVESESGALQQRLEVTEEMLGERERELTEARERITSLSDELVISHGKVCITNMTAGNGHVHLRSVLRWLSFLQHVMWPF